MPDAGMASSRHGQPRARRSRIQGWVAPGDSPMNDEAIGKADGLGEGLFSMLFDLLPDYFYVYDSDMRVVYVNTTAADYFRLPKDEIVGKIYKDLEPNKEFAHRFNELGRQIMAT